jgi:thermostable 8-oxoguanine DNA glycosylase
MLFDSSVYAVTSVQNDISILRRFFREYANAEDWGEVKKVFRSVNYGNNKFEYCLENASVIFGETGDQIISLLEAGDVWEAVELMVNEMMGVSYIKAPFVGCMLGYTSLMCIDTNVAQMVPDDRVKASDYKDGQQYKEAVALVKQHYEDLAAEYDPFMLQWVLFDANRGDGVARHEEWFEQMLPGTQFGSQASLTDF